MWLLIQMLDGIIVFYDRNHTAFVTSFLLALLTPNTQTMAQQQQLFRNLHDTSGRVLLVRCGLMQCGVP